MSGEPAKVLINRALKLGKGTVAVIGTKFSSPDATIAGGADITLRTQNGRWDVTGRLTVGLDGEGRLEVSRSGGLTTNEAVLGDGAPGSGGTALAVVTDPGSFWHSKSLVIGNRSNASLTVGNVATVEISDRLEIASGGTLGLLDVDNATLSAFSVSVGGGATGHLTLRNGGIIQTHNFFVGDSSVLNTRNSNATVESDGLLRVTDFFAVAKGNLTINDGIVDRIPMQSDGSGNGSRILEGAALAVLKGHFHEARSLKVDGTLTIDHNNGSVSVGRDLIETPGQLSITSEGFIFGFGTIRGKVVVLGGDNVFGGQVLPGNSPGTLTIDGDYEQDGGLLGIEMAGTLPGQFDVLAVTGNATLGGTLSLEFIDGFAPHQGDMFKFLDVGGARPGRSNRSKSTTYCRASNLTFIATRAD